MSIKKALIENAEFLTNREKNLTPRKTRFYCGCDMALVRPGGKCPKCSSRQGKRRLMK
jgi:spore coat polysaccharide biosynthesis predicted glycosyltransferase SpsG